MKKSRILCLVLALIMMLSVVACNKTNDNQNQNQGENNNQQENNTPDNPDTPDNPEGPQPPVDDGTLKVDTVDLDTLDMHALYAECDAIYDEVFGEYSDLYLAARAETKDIDQRFANMAIAEAKLLETGVTLPNYDQSGSYGMSPVIPHTAPSIAWGVDSSSIREYQNALVCETFLTPDERAELTAKWLELRGTGTWLEWAKQWAADNGHTLTDTINYVFSSSDMPTNWDVLTSSGGNDSFPVAGTLDSLLNYDTENELRPSLAESYEVSDDGLTYTFHIRKGVQWVNYQGSPIGAEVTADDFVAALQHMYDDKNGPTYILSPVIVNLAAYDSGEITDFSQVGIKAVDDYTLQYTLVEATPWFITCAGYTIMYPMNRAYYQSQGGKFGQEYDPSAADYTYGTDPQHIAYCGMYLISNFTEKNTMNFVANPTYWNKDNVTIKNINLRYIDGTDPLAIYNGTMRDHIYNMGVSLGENQRPLAESTVVPDDPDGKTYFEKYAYVSNANGKYGFMWWVNLNRTSYKNYNDGAMPSTQTVTQAERTHAALLNHNFRMALVMSVDRGATNAPVMGEETKELSLINSFVPGDFVSLTADTTVDINGTPTTFKAGTYYGEILQAQITADGYPMKVWDPEGNDGAGSSKGFEGWYNPEAAKEYLDKAIEELAAEGILINEEYPIYLDTAGATYSPNGQLGDNAAKQSIESALGGLVKFNIVESATSTEFGYATFNGFAGYRMNYDYQGGSGWAPDYGDPQTYLDVMLPEGDFIMFAGMY